MEKKKQTHEYKILQNKPENVTIIRKILKGDTHALVWASNFSWKVSLKMTGKIIKKPLIPRREITYLTNI